MAKKLNKNGKDQKYTNSVKTMMIFVASYLIQNSSYIIYACWLLVETPHVAIMVCVVCFTNLGGLYNLIVYVIIRRLRAVKIDDARIDSKTKVEIGSKGQTNSYSG